MKSSFLKWYGIVFKSFCSATWHISKLSNVNPSNRESTSTFYTHIGYIAQRAADRSTFCSGLIQFRNCIAIYDSVLEFMCPSKRCKTTISLLWPFSVWFQMLVFRISLSLVSLFFVIMVPLHTIYLLWFYFVDFFSCMRCIQNAVDPCIYYASKQTGTLFKQNLYGPDPLASIQSSYYTFALPEKPVGYFLWSLLDLLNWPEWQSNVLIFNSLKSCTTGKK